MADKRLSSNEKKRLLAAEQRVRQIPRGKWRGESSYRPGLTVLLNGKLTEDLEYGGRAKFKQWASEDPTDPDSEEEELDYDEEYCYSWSFLKDGEKITSEARVALYWYGGRWYVDDADQCPVPV